MIVLRDMGVDAWFCQPLFLHRRFPTEERYNIDYEESNYVYDDT